MSRLRGLLVVVAAVLMGSLALPTAPASAGATHGLSFRGTVDIRDDDTINDTWCRGRTISQSVSLNHQGGRVRTLSVDNITCDEVRIEVSVRAELMPDDRICNIELEVSLYEGHRNDSWITDLDGRTRWAGGMDWCISPGQWLHWDEIRVDNTAEGRSYDAAWVRDFRLTH